MARAKLWALPLLAIYLLPPALPGVSGLLHDGYHLLGSLSHPASHHDLDHHHSGSQAHVHSHPGDSHEHAPIVDSLLISTSSEDLLEEAHGPSEVGPQPGAHLPSAAEGIPGGSIPRLHTRHRAAALPPSTLPRPPLPPPRSLLLLYA
jgi:hypothetical protein